MHPDRPVNLPLPRLAAAMPVTAIASFLHRVTGIVLFAGTLFLCYVLDLALADEAGFERAAAIIEAPPGALATWAILTSLAYHVVAASSICCSTSMSATACGPPRSALG